MGGISKRQELMNTMYELGYTPVSVDVNKYNHKVYVVYWKCGEEVEIGFSSYDKATEYFKSK